MISIVTSLDSSFTFEVNSTTHTLTGVQVMSQILDGVIGNLGRIKNEIVIGWMLDGQSTLDGLKGLFPYCITLSHLGTMEARHP